jgi:hypothetical protein
VPRTLLDLAAVVPQGVLEHVCNQAEIKRMLDMRAIEALLTRRAGQPGVRRLRTLLATGEVGTDRTRTELERRFFALSKQAGLPRPAVNEWMAIAGEEWECDFVWHSQRVIVEVDGWETHRTRWAFKNDRRRDRVVRMHGWEPLRFTWDDVVNDPRHVEEVVVNALTARS